MPSARSPAHRSMGRMRWRRPCMWSGRSRGAAGARSLLVRDPRARPDCRSFLLAASLVAQVSRLDHVALLLHHRRAGARAPRGQAARCDGSLSTSPFACSLPPRRSDICWRTGRARRSAEPGAAARLAERTRLSSPSPATRLAALLVAACGLAAGLWRLAQRKRVPDHLLFLTLGVWIPLLQIGCFQWDPATRYVDGTDHAAADRGVRGWPVGLGEHGASMDADAQRVAANAAAGVVRRHSEPWPLPSSAPWWSTPRGCRQPSTRPMPAIPDHEGAARVHRVAASRAATISSSPRIRSCRRTISATSTTGCRTKRWRRRSCTRSTAAGRHLYRHAADRVRQRAGAARGAARSGRNLRHRQRREWRRTAKRSCAASA